MKLVRSIILGFFVFISCTPEPLEVPLSEQIGALPLVVLAPNDNPQIDSKIALGKALFWDPILSGHKDVACATCHHPDHGYAEQLDLSLGVGGRGLSEGRTGGSLVIRNSMSIINTAFNGINSRSNYKPEEAPMFWDNRRSGLESQSLGPILSAEEMRGTAYKADVALDSVINRLENIELYQEMFLEAFGETGIDSLKLARALAAFERTIISNQSKFDQYVRGDDSALSDLEVRGMVAFSEVGCDNCHGGPMFSDFETHVLGVPHNIQLKELDHGDGKDAFRTPSLRNLSLTAPYMHNGIFNTIEEVMDFYDDVQGGGEGAQLSVPSHLLDEKLIDLELQDEHVDAIIAFLHSLEDDSFDRIIPTTVPSGLSVGGEIK